MLIHDLKFSILFPDMVTQRKQTLDILVDGKRKRLRGVTKYTTCDDVIKMVIKKTIQPHAEKPMFAVFESFNGKERQLSRKDRIIKVLRSWGSDSKKIVISVRRIADIKNKMTTIKDKKKRLNGLRTKAFTNISRQKVSFLSNGCSLDLTNASDISKKRLASSSETLRSVDHDKVTGIIKQKFEVDNKQSVFRRIFTNVLKRRKVSKDEMKRKVNLKKSVLSSEDNVTSKKDYTYMDLQQSFKSQLDVIDSNRIGKLGKLPELDTAFVDEADQLGVETADVSVLNTCIMEDPEVGCNDMDENNVAGGEETFVKLNRIKKLFDSNNTQYRTDDDFMDSFMRSKLYESESDTDC